jgi:hypothetical protein
MKGSPHKIEQTALPSACLGHPQLEGDYETRLITANTELKVRRALPGRWCDAMLI